MPCGVYPPARKGETRLSKIYDNITQTIGRTPLVRINRLNKNENTILVKLESFNPLASVKDRAGLAMIEAAEAAGSIGKESTIIEPTSGNTGIALAFICAQRGYRLILTMPETMSSERRHLLKFLGAEVVLTEGEKGMRGAIEKAEALLATTKGGFMPQQFNNLANVEVHRRTTAEEIWEDSGGEIDFFISGIGTGGTISGVGEVLKKRRPAVKVIGIEPLESAVLSGGTPNPHKIQGIGAGFVPSILKREVIDELIKVSHKDAGQSARDLAKEEGILVGISGGAALWATLQVASRKEAQGKTLITVLPDTGERYISTWLFQMEETQGRASVASDGVEQGEK